MEWDESQNSSTGLCSQKVTLWTSISKRLLEFLVETGSLQLVEMECHTSVRLQKSKMFLQIMKQFKDYAPLSTIFFYLPIIDVRQIKVAMMATIVNIFLKSVP